MGAKHEFAVKSFSPYRGPKLPPLVILFQTTLNHTKLHATQGSFWVVVLLTKVKRKQRLVMHISLPDNCLKMYGTFVTGHVAM